MEESSLIIITLSKAKNSKPTGGILEELNVYMQWLKNKADNQTLVFIPPIREYIQLGKRICENFGCFLYIIDKLSTIKNPKYTQIENDFKSIPICQTENNFLEVTNFANFFRSFSKPIIILMDANIFEALDFICRTTRNKTHSSIHEISFDSEDLELADRTISQDEILKFFKDIGEDVYDSYLSHPLEAEASIKKIFSLLDRPLLNPKPSINDETNIESHLKKLKKVLEKTEGQLNAINNIIEESEKEISTSFKKTKKGSIKIARFDYDSKTNSWILKLKNITPDSVSKVQVCIIENSEKICEFKKVQGNSSVKINLPLKYDENYYNCHLLALSHNIIISEVFSIKPYHLSLSSPVSENCVLLIKIINTSIRPWANLNIISTQNNKSIPIGEYDDEINFQLENTIKVQIYLASDNSIISNPLIIKI